MADKETAEQSNHKPNRRRTALKSLGVAGGIAAASAPSSWTRPLVSSVVLPVHATTSNPAPPAPFAGVFGTGAVTTQLFENNWWEHSDLLAGLIPSAHAGFRVNPASGVATSVCGDGGNGGGTFEITVSVDDTAVRVCFSSTGGPQNCTKEGTSTLSGESIADFQIDPVDDDIDGSFGQERVVFSNMRLVAESMVTGTLTIERSAPMETTLFPCAQDFMANLIPGGAYSCAIGCTDLSNQDQ